MIYGARPWLEVSLQLCFKQNVWYSLFSSQFMGLVVEDCNLLFNKQYIILFCVKGDKIYVYKMIGVSEASFSQLQLRNKLCVFVKNYRVC
jgi:hypothetical protein